MDIGRCTDDAPDGGWRCRCRAAPVGRPRCARGGGPLAAPDGAGILCPWRGRGRRSFPLAGKNQRATGGSQTETAPWLPPDPSPLGLGVKPHVARGYWLPRGGGMRVFGVLCHLSAGGRAAPVGRPRCAQDGGYVRAWGCMWTDRADTLRFSALVHGRRSRSNLRRPPQEVAASLDHGGARSPHAKRGDRRGAAPERDQPEILPRRGRCHGVSRDG